MENRLCPVCSYNENFSLYKNKLVKIDNKIDLSYDVVVCKVCGMIFANNLPSKKIYSHYYQNYQKHDISTYIRNNASKIILKDIIKRFSKEKRFLDIGCSNGYFLNLLKKNGYKNLNGIEPSPAAKQIAKKLYNIDIDTGFFNKQYNIFNIDIFILSSVLEHVSDVNSFLQPFNKIKQESFIYLLIPDASKFCEIKNSEIFGEFSCEHINYFDKNSITNLMSNIGFAPVFCKSISHSNDIKDIFCLFQNTGIKAVRRADFILFSKINKYIKQNEKKLEEFLNIFNEQERIIIYGAGSHTLKFLEKIEKRTQIDCIVDDSPTLVGKKIKNYIVKPISYIKGKRIPIFLSTRNFINQMKDNIKNVNSDAEVIFFQKYQ